MLPDYQFYTETYHGNQITEIDFPRLINRAGVFLQNLRCESDDEKYSMAACAVAEAWQQNEQGGDLISQTVGSWSKSYSKGKRSDTQRLLDAASLYLGNCAVRWA